MPYQHTVPSGQCHNLILSTHLSSPMFKKYDGCSFHDLVSNKCTRSMSRLMQLTFVSMLLLLSAARADARQPASPHITVMGLVYCDICSNNSFSTNSYFLPGVQVQIDCKFKATNARNAEEVTFSGKRSTDRQGIYRLEIASVDGIQCAKDKAIGNSCKATLLSSSAAACNVPASATTSDEVLIVKAAQSNTCIYTLATLNFRPSAKDPALC